MGRSASLFSGGASAGIAAALVIPLLIRLCTTVEPFPAMLLPSGANLLTVSKGTASTNPLFVMTVDERGRERRLDPSKLIDPVPVQYLSAIVRDGFGFDRSETREVGFGAGRLKAATVRIQVPRHVPTEADRKALARWLRKRVVKAGGKGSRIVARRERLRIVRATGESHVVKKGEETVIDVR